MGDEVEANSCSSIFSTMIESNFQKSKHACFKTKVVR